MTLLKIYSENETNETEVIKDFEEIKKTLNSFGIGIERWQTQEELADNAEQEAILEAYKEDITRIMQDHGFNSVDVISMHRGSKLSDTEKQAARNKFLTEHTHSDDEVRFFIDGQGLFSIHAAAKVFQLLCKAGDFVSVPAMTRHWFDMGAEANFKCIRFFGEEAGWVASYTGDDIASSFPKLEEFCHCEERSDVAIQAH